MNKNVLVIGLLICAGSAFGAYKLYSASVKNMPPPVAPSSSQAPSEIFNEKGELISRIPIVLDFYADWCGPCRLEGPVVEAESKAWTGKVQFIKINIDNPDGRRLAAASRITSIPTLIMLDPQTKQAHAHTGYMNQEELHNFVQSSLSDAPANSSNKAL